jgi:hypothetical protein
MITSSSFPTPEIAARFIIKCCGIMPGPWSINNCMGSGLGEWVHNARAKALTATPKQSATLRLEMIEEAKNRIVN